MRIAVVAVLLLGVACKDEASEPTEGAPLPPAAVAVLVPPEAHALNMIGPPEDAAPAGLGPAPIPMAPATCAEQERLPAVIEVEVGGGFEHTTLYVEGLSTNTLGRQRVFESPGLCPGREYSYSMEFRWSGGKSQAKTFTVKGGETSKVSMP